MYKGDHIIYSKGKEIFPRFPSYSFCFNCFSKEGTVTGVNIMAQKRHLWPALRHCWPTQQSMEQSIQQPWIPSRICPVSSSVKAQRCSDLCNLSATLTLFSLASKIQQPHVWWLPCFKAKAADDICTYRARRKNPTNLMQHSFKTSTLLCAWRTAKLVIQLHMHILQGSSHSQTSPYISKFKKPNVQFRLLAAQGWIPTSSAERTVLDLPYVTRPT